jgi:molecular chaperone HscA
MAAGAARIRVTFQVDADGLLAVTARETRTGVEASISVKPSYGLNDDEIARMLQSSFGAAQFDMQARALREQQVEADRLLEALKAAIARAAAGTEEFASRRMDRSIRAVLAGRRIDEISTS